VPASWRVLYREGDAWTPVAAEGPYAVEKDRFNRIAFSPVTTTGLRLEVIAQPDASIGIQEWMVK
jgi:hypothetical protein